MNEWDQFPVAKSANWDQFPAVRNSTPPPQPLSLGSALMAAPGAAMSELGSAAKAAGNFVASLPSDPLGYKIGRALKAAPGAAMDASNGMMQYMRNLSPPEMRGSAPMLPGGEAKNHPFLALAAGDTAPIKQQIAERPLRLAGDIASVIPMSGVARLPEIAAKIPMEAAPTIAALNAGKKAAYKIVDNSPMRIAAPEVAALHTDLTTQLSRMGLTDKTLPVFAPKVATAMAALKDASATHQTLQDMDMQRRIAGIAAGSTDKTERAAARIVQDGIDKLLTNLKPEQLHGPIDPAAIAALPQARDLANRSFKAQQLQDIIDKAKNNSTGFSQSGYENALRNGFRKLLNNDRGIARFSPQEQAMIKQVATGGSSLSATNLLRQIGKLSPQGAIPILAELGMYGAVGPAALAVPAAGIAGRTGATILQSNAAKRAVEAAARGRAPIPRAPFGVP